jgi:hypothetical protein
MKISKVCLSISLVAILITCLSITTAHSQGVPDLSIWVGKWFKGNAAVTGMLEFESIGVKYFSASGGSNPAYVFVSGWSSTSRVLTIDVWAWNDRHDIDRWENFFPALECTYIAGSNLDFLCWTTQTPPVDNPGSVGNWMGAMFRFTGRLDKFAAMRSASLKTQGGFIWEVENTAEILTGGLKITGTLINPSIFCESPKNSNLPPCLP